MNIKKQINENSQLVGNFIWLISHRFIKMILALIIGIFIARYLGPENYGILNYALSFVAIIAPLSTLGLNSILTRDIVNEPDSESIILGSAAILRLTGALVGTVIALLSVSLLRPNDNQMLLFVVIISASNLFQSIQVVEFWFRAKQKLSAFIISQISVVFLFTIIKALLIIFEFKLITFIIVFTLEITFNYGVMYILYNKFSEYSSDWKFSKGRSLKLLSQSWPLILSAFAAIIYLKIDQVMLGTMISDEAVGIYAVAAKFSEVWYFIPTAIMTALFPSLLEKRKKSKTEYFEGLQKTLDLLAMIALIIAIPVTIISKPFINFLYGADYSLAGSILSIHIWASVFIFMRALLSKWLIAESLFHFSIITHGIGAVTNLILNFILIPRLGVFGAAYATIISYSAASYFSLFPSRKTRTIGYMMTLSLVYPFRLVFSRIR